MVAQGRPGLAKGNNFGVRRRVEVGKIAIPPSTDDCTGVNNDGAYRNFASFQGALCHTEGFFHPEFVRGSKRSVVVGHWSRRADKSHCSGVLDQCGAPSTIAI
jgi:hypothetical protein